MSEDVPLDSYTRSYLGSEPVKGPWLAFGAPRSVLRASAENYPQEEPALEVLEDQRVAGRRHLRVRVKSSRGAQQLTLWESTGASITTEAVEESNISSNVRFSPALDRFLWTLVTGEPLDHWSLDFYAPAADGFVVAISFDETLRPVLVVKDVTDSLLSVEGLAPKRGPGVLPAPWGDRTFAFRRYEL